MYKKMHQSDYCMQTSVLKLSDTKKIQIRQLLFVTCEHLMVVSYPTKRSAAKLHLRAWHRSKITKQYVMFT